MFFVKITHIRCCKLVKIEETFSYEDYENIAKNKFPELKNEAIYFTDKEGTILEEDVFIDFITNRRNHDNSNEIELMVGKIHNSDGKPIQSASTISVMGNDTDNWLSEDSSNTEGSNIADKENVMMETRNNIQLEVSTADHWKSVIMEKGGSNIFEEYGKLGILSNTLRMKLVNISCGVLVENFGLKVPEFAKRNLAQCIITLFPNLRDHAGKTGYEAFYTNNNGGEGYISWRLRTITRNFNKDKKRKRSDKKNEEPPPKVPAYVPNLEVEEAVEFLKNISSSDKNESAIFEKMALTFNYRQTLHENMLTIFPRFLDTPHLIENDFELGGFKKVDFEKVFTDDVVKILHIYKTTVKNPLLSIVGDGSNELLSWSAATRAILALVYMLPPGPKYRNKGTGNNECVEDKLIIFKQVNTPMTEIIQQKKTSQPILVAQGQSKSAIVQYNLIVDSNSIPCPRHCSSIKAFELLFMSHYVFHVQYDDWLIHFWQFLQTYYFQLEIDNVSYTPKMIELRSRLQNTSV